MIDHKDNVAQVLKRIGLKKNIVWTLGDNCADINYTMIINNMIIRISYLMSLLFLSKSIKSIFYKFCSICTYMIGQILCDAIQKLSKVCDFSYTYIYV